MSTAFTCQFKVIIDTLAVYVAGPVRCHHHHHRLPIDFDEGCFKLDHWGVFSSILPSTSLFSFFQWCYQHQGSFPRRRSIFGITLPRVYIHVSCLQMTLQNIFVTQLLPTTFLFPDVSSLYKTAFGSLSSGILTT